MTPIQPSKQLTFLFLLTLVITRAGFAQQTAVVDSSLLDRISALEQQVHEQRSGEDHFMVVGLTTFGFFNTRTVNTAGGVSQVSKTNSLGDATDYEFSPMLLWRHGDKFLMSFEPSFNNDGLSVNWADISWFAAPGLIVRGGYLVIPFGIYNKRLAAGWINKFATDPIGITDIPANSDYGVEVEGGFPLGTMKWSYDVALTNGMQLLLDGELDGTGISDINLNKTVSGRFGLLPFSNSSLEVGVSGLYGNVAAPGSGFVNANTSMFAGDLSFVRTFHPFLVNIKAQYDLVKVNRQPFVSPVDSTKSYSFDNTTKNGFAQISFRSTGAGHNWLKNLELAYRYGNLTTPSGSLWGAKTAASDVALDYWLSWRSVIKVTYEFSNGNSTTDPNIGAGSGNTKTYSWYVQFSIQL